MECGHLKRVLAFVPEVPFQASGGLPAWYSQLSKPLGRGSPLGLIFHWCLQCNDDANTLNPASSSCHLLPASPRKRSSFPWIRGSQHWPVPESLGGPVKTRVARLHPPQVLIQQVGVQGFAFLTSSQVIQMPQVRGPHFENHCWALPLNQTFCLAFLLFNPPLSPSSSGWWDLTNTLGEATSLSDFLFIICKMGTILSTRKSWPGLAAFSYPLYLSGKKKFLLIANKEGPALFLIPPLAVEMGQT